MYRPTKQTPPKKDSSVLTIACIAIAFVAVMFGMGQHEDAQMARYAQANNCTWHATGSFYGDQRDYVCK